MTDHVLASSSDTSPETVTLRHDVPVFAAYDVSVGYGRPPHRGHLVLSDVNVSLRAGELACLVGENGAGKSTLLRSLARFQPLLDGEVRIDDQPVGELSKRELARRIAVVLTDRVAAGSMRAWDVVALGRFPFTGWGGRLTRRDHQAIGNALTATRATHLGERPLGELSDGERQRIMIARALAQEPRLLLLDEPSAFLDVRGRLELIDLLVSLTREHGLAVLMSTHDLELMMRHADTVWMVEGDHLLVGAPEDLGILGGLQRSVGGTATFDPHTGTFRSSRAATGLAHVVAQGDVAAWARRAVERAGYAVDIRPDSGWADGDGRSDVHVELAAMPTGDGPPRWHVRHGAACTEMSCLGDVVAWLRDASAAREPESLRACRARCERQTGVG